MSEQRIPVVAVLGPTAGGKTALAVTLAKRFGGEVVSCDSMQIYKELSVSTARPTPAETDGVPHHLMGFLSIESSYSVADYVTDAGRVIEEINRRGRRAFLCGGTGQYADALLDGMRFEGEAGSAEKKAELAAFYSENGLAALTARLRKADPDAAGQIDVKNPKRVLRALEIVEALGTPLRDYHQRNLSSQSPYRSLKIVIDFKDRNNLYERINLRVEKMLSDGLVKEAREMYNRNIIATASQAIGCKELTAYFEGEKSLEECADRIRRATRRYAKRQQTWFRRERDAHFVYADEEDVCARSIALCEQFYGEEVPQ